MGYVKKFYQKNENDNFVLAQVEIPVDLVPIFHDRTNWFKLCSTVFNRVLNCVQLANKKPS